MNNATQNKPERDFGADCVRVLAICLLFWLHFYLKNGFYYAHESTIMLGVASTFVPIFLSCVPLFAVLTGYLKCNKKWTPRYYLSILPIIFSWLIISGLHYIYKVFYLQESKSALEWFTELVTFKLADYSWYVGMYMGLFILCPLLNLIWHGCKSHKQHVAVLVSLFCVSSLPNFISGITGIAVLPTYFTQMLYVLYYFIGCYIATYRPKARPWICLVVILGLGILLSVVNIVTRTEPYNYYKGYSLGYSHPALIVITVSFFLLVYRARTDSKVIRRIAQAISSVTLEMYLISFLFDSFVYPYRKGEYGFALYLPVGLVMTAIVFTTSWIGGTGVHQLSTLLYKLVCKLGGAISKRTGIFRKEGNEDEIHRGGIGSGI